VNGRDATAHGQVTYYNGGGAVALTEPITLAPDAQVLLNMTARLPGGFNGSAVVTTTDYKVFAELWAGSTSAHTLGVYGGRDTGAEFFHFPVAQQAAGGWGSTLTALNLSATQPVTFSVTFNSPGGSPVTQDVLVPPHGQWDLAASGVPGLPAGFDGTAQVAWYWPWQTGWSEGFPLLAVGRNRMGNASASEATNGILSGLLTWSVTGLTPRDMLDRSFANNWAGGLGWSYYETGTGHWADYVAAQQGFSAANAAAVNIQPLVPPTATSTPGNPATATAQAYTPTPAYGNAATATAAAGSPTAGPACCSGTFNDVPPDAYYAIPVKYLNCRGFVSGYTCGGPGDPCPGAYFHPANNTTRGQFTKILVLGRGWPIQTPVSPTFNDVSATSPFYPYIETAYARGVISGYDCGGPGEPCPGLYFRPSNNITRGQLSKLIMLGMGWVASPPPDPDYTFADVPRSNPFFSYIETIVAHGVVSGYTCGGLGEPCDPQGHAYFRPGNNGTRAQLSKMLYIALSNP
jgi:hypothetical protein